MNTWAVIKTGGKQYKVEEGKSIAIEKIDGKTEGAVIFDDVLAIRTEKGLVVGTPKVEKAKVRGKIEEAYKEKKIRVVKYKSKSRYTRTTGHRQQKLKVTIEKIEN